MKNLLITLSAILLIVMTACKKDIDVCKEYEEIKRNSNHLVDINSINNAPELLDTLQKYQRLRVINFEVYPWGWRATCNIFYKGLPVFSDKYTLANAIHYEGITTSDTNALKPVPDISITPKIPIEEAVKKAKQYINLDHTCTQYELGCFMINSWTAQRKYVVAWKIRGKDYNLNTIILNAETNNVLATNHYLMYE
ncbi:MAG: hypothetical protein KF900_14620 [Bacteroidetes bacterium]|nr:hypothetical protein [Bacteroidota bacterium]